jgi:hypothetical protein
VSDDRRVHARFPWGTEVVRYERAGKWYLEARDGARDSIKFLTAVHYGRKAANQGGEVFFGVSGGTRFDAAVRADLAARDDAT